MKVMYYGKFQKDIIAFNIIAYGFLSIVAIFCFLPFWLLLVGSITSEHTISTIGFSLYPKEISLSAFELLFKNPSSILRSYGVTIFVTAVGTMLALLLTSMASYSLSDKKFKMRNKFAFFFYFTTIFSGGIVPYYVLLVRYYHMKNNILVLILPSLFNVFYMIIIRSFMNSIPDSLKESAKCDGASHYRILFQIYLPLSKSALATTGLFIALGYWNEWFNSMLFIDKPKLFPLQYYLHMIMSKLDFLRNNSSKSGMNITVDLPKESFKMAVTVVTVGPILLLYPYLQKYFIKGIMIGAVKG